MIFFSMLPLQIASEYVGIFMPFTRLMVNFIVIKLKLGVTVISLKFQYLYFN